MMEDDNILCFGAHLDSRKGLLRGKGPAKISPLKGSMRINLDMVFVWRDKGAKGAAPIKSRPKWAP